MPMAKRSRVEELKAIQARRGRGGGLFPSVWDLHDLKSAWNAQEKNKELIAKLLPARIVTLIEVFCRYWIQKLIDQGSPYEERVADLKVDIKYDFALARNFHGRSISIGLLISRSLSLPGVSSVDSVFSKLLDLNFFIWLSQVKRRRDLELEDEEIFPIVRDKAALLEELTRLFEVRHILVHEFPVKQPMELIEINGFFNAAEEFMDATDEGLSQLLYGKYPLSQREMNAEARETSEKAMAELEELVQLIARETASSEILDVHKKWKDFSEAEAARISEPSAGGSIAPLVYSSALTVLTPG